MATRVFGTISARATCRSEKADDGDHAQEVHETRALEVVEEDGELGELHGLPDHQAREHLQDDDEDDADVEHALHRVVVREVVVGELERQGRCASRR